MLTLILIAATYDVQKVAISVENGIINITCWFAKGTSARGAKVKILSHKNDESAFRFLRLSEECAINDSLLCSASTYFKLEVESFGNFTIVVFDWEKDGNTTKVYSEEFILTSRTLSTFPMYYSTDGPMINPTQANIEVETGINSM